MAKVPALYHLLMIGLDEPRLSWSIFRIRLAQVNRYLSAGVYYFCSDSFCSQDIVFNVQIEVLLLGVLVLVVVVYVMTSPL